MDAIVTAMTRVWVLFCLAMVVICAPTAALRAAAGAGPSPINPGAALVWSWLTIAMLVPLTVTVRGFNWGTALLLSAVCPAALWLYRHRGGERAAFQQLVRSLVFYVVKPRRAPSARFMWRMVPRTLVGLLLLGALLLIAGHTDVRLPVPADFDTLWRTRQLLAGTPVWDPLAALAALATRVSASETLATIGALRLALVALTAAASGLLTVEILGRQPVAMLVPLGVMTLTPLAPLSTWAVVLLLAIGSTSVVRLMRTGCSHDGWHAAAAFVLAVAHVMPFTDRPDVLWRVSSHARYLEHRAAPTEALRIARLSADDDWVLVGPPEQQLELDGRGRFYDLARFVSRFRDRAGHTGFRFDLGTGRLFVIVEKQPLDVSRAAPGVRFVSAQPAAYRVPVERTRLGQLARDICDDYRRTHAGTAIVYDDAVLRVYRIDL